MDQVTHQHFVNGHIYGLQRHDALVRGGFVESKWSRTVGFESLGLYLTLLGLHQIGDGDDDVDSWVQSLVLCGF